MKALTIRNAFMRKATAQYYSVCVMKVFKALFEAFSTEYWHETIMMTDKALAQAAGVSSGSMSRVKEFLRGEGWISTSLKRGRTVYVMIDGSTQIKSPKLSQPNTSAPPETFAAYKASLSEADLMRLEAALTDENAAYVAKVYNDRRLSMSNPLRYLIKTARTYKPRKGQITKAEKVQAIAIMQEDRAEYPVLEREEPDKAIMTVPGGLACEEVTQEPDAATKELMAEEMRRASENVALIASGDRDAFARTIKARSWSDIVRLGNDLASQVASGMSETIVRTKVEELFRAVEDETQRPLTDAEQEPTRQDARLIEVLIRKCPAECRQQMETLGITYAEYCDARLLKAALFKYKVLHGDLPRSAAFDAALSEAREHYPLSTLWGEVQAPERESIAVAAKPLKQISSKEVVRMLFAERPISIEKTTINEEELRALKEVAKADALAREELAAAKAAERERLVLSDDWYSELLASNTRYHKELMALDATLQAAVDAITGGSL